MLFYSVDESPVVRFFFLSIQPHCSDSILCASIIVHYRIITMHRRRRRRRKTIEAFAAEQGLKYTIYQNSILHICVSMSSDCMIWYTAAMPLHMPAPNFDLI